MMLEYGEGVYGDGVDVSYYTVTTDALASYLGQKIPASVEVERVHAAAVDTLGEAVADAYRPIPSSVVDEMLLRVGRSIWDTRKTQQAAQQLTQVQGEPGTRPARDPLAAITPILARYVVPL